MRTMQTWNRCLEAAPVAAPWLVATGAPARAAIFELTTRAGTRGVTLRTWVGVAVLMVLGGRAFGEDAEALLKRGLELRRQGQHEAGLEAIRKSHELAPTPRATAQLAFAEQAVGRWPEAEEHLTTAMNAPSDPWMVKNRAVVDQALATIRTHTAYVTIEGVEPGATLTADGRALGTAPLPAAAIVQAGTLDVVARAPGFAEAAKSITVSAGERTRVFLRMVRTAASAPSTPESAQPGAVVPAPPSDARLNAQDTSVTAPSGASLTWPIAAGAAGVALVAAGTWALVTMNGKIDRIEADAASNREYDEDNGNYETFGTISAVTYTLGAAALVGAGVLYFHGRAREASQRVAFAPRGRGGLSGSLTWTF